MSEPTSKTGVSQLSQYVANFELPAKAASDSLALIGPSADKLPGSLDRTGFAADRLQARFDALQPTAGAQPGGASGLLSIFGGYRANGGRGQRGKSYVTGERGMELFTPGANGFFTPNDHLLGQSSDIQGALTGVSKNSSESHYNITLNVTGDTKDAERLAQELVARLELKMRELDRRTRDVDHYDRMMAKALQIGRERY